MFFRFLKGKVRTAVKWTFFALFIVGLFMMCEHCVPDRGERKIVRVLADVSDFSVVFIDGQATLYWVDSTDLFFAHAEISWQPNNRVADEDTPVTVEKGVGKYVIPDLEEDKEYTFTVTAVDRWGNKSDIIEGGAGKAFKQRKPNDAPPSEIMSIKGTPVAEQAILSWTNLADSEYDHIEITCDPPYETPVRVVRGVESKMLANLVNDVEYTFYVSAVDGRGNRKPLNEIGLFISDFAASPESVFGRSSAGQVILTWEDPANPDLDYIEIVYTPRGETPVSVDKGMQFNTLTNLSDIIDYEFTAYAVDTAGRRRPVTNVNLRSPLTPIFNGRDADKIVVRGKPAGGVIQLDWEDPPMPDIDHIAIIYQPENGDMPVTVVLGEENKLFTGLADNREYIFVVYGVDSKNNNRVITGVQLTTPQILELVAQPVSGRATLVWSPPDNPNLDYIEVSYAGMNRPVRLAKGRERYTFTGLSDHQKYEFKVMAVTTERNTHAVASARVIVARLPVLMGMPVDQQLSLAWIDPTDITIDRIEVVYSPGGERPRSVARGMESVTFSNLSNDVRYTFTVYALDSVGNRHPVGSPKFYDPNTAFVLRSEPRRRRDNLVPLTWRATGNTTFGNSAVSTLSFGIAANGSTRWVAGGSEGRIAYSNDYGINWVPVIDSTFGSYSIDSIHYANGRWIAAGKNGKMAWSTNAILWNAVSRFDFTVNFNINTVAFGNGRWIAGGSNGSIIVSDDNGVSWRRIATDVFGRSAINTIVFHNGRWMAGGAAGKIAYSDDNGVTWTAVENSAFGNSAINVIIYDDERWLAGGYAQRIAWSSNGITWQSMSRPFYILCMGFNGFRWIIGGQRGRMAWSGDGGDTWITDELSYNHFGENWIETVASGRAPDGRVRWLAGGQNGRIIYSDER